MSLKSRERERICKEVYETLEKLIFPPKRYGLTDRLMDRQIELRSNTLI